MNCQAIFDRRLAEHNGNIKRGRKRTTCSAKCAASLRRKYIDRSKLCKNCGETFIFEKTEQKFCSKSCSAKFTNQKRKKYCTICDIAEVKGKTNFCKECREERAFSLRENDSYRIMTLKELRDKYGTHQFHGKVRGHARSVFKRSKLEYKCAVPNCEFNLHVQIAHIISIKDFPETATIFEVNQIENLKPLCPNHHWMYDHGMMYDWTVGLPPQKEKLTKGMFLFL